ncbi:NUDIX hydrolase [Aminobacter aganoensis]|uniref:ADP-ribose pyrophosphatase YjhB (NUDIX family) n=1 Tax=Aminobacter aganoensis TaxID=83264 RepID=A0A7X0F5E8_9HYPH|nr:MULTISPECIES: NUDIX domain-containing protein [Aminobacter]KQU65890.1 DNA mismatch repair protein MutT [Aminobacter sp. DSM 101952]MBB6353290.1 ADP-ribose pyrophosphatase YjhB (NUDIX family) [Aminobacter aganoensis]
MTEAKIVPAVSVAVLRDRSIMLVRRGRAPSKGLYAFPGGRVEQDETLEAAARRELMEETGIEVGTLVALRKILIDSRDDGGAVYLLTVFGARHAGGQPVAADDADEAAFFDLAEIERLPLTDSTLEIVLELLDGTVTLLA